MEARILYLRSLISLLVAPLIVGLCSCSSPIPDRESYDHFYGEYMAMIEGDLAKLDTMYETGEITDAQFNEGRAELLDNLPSKVAALMYHNHTLNERYYESQGLPTANGGASPGNSMRGHGNVGAGRRGFGGAGIPGSNFGGGFGGAQVGSGDFGRIY